MVSNQTQMLGDTEADFKKYYKLSKTFCSSITSEQIL